MVKQVSRASKSRKASSAGPTVATINGLNSVSFGKGLTTNPMGKPVFTNVQIGVDLPKESSTYNIVIPANKADEFYLTFRQPQNLANYKEFAMRVYFPILLLTLLTVGPAFRGE